jgi:hypothetical protein
MKLTINGRIIDEKKPNEPSVIVGECQVDLPDNVSKVIVNSTRIVSLIMDTANKIKEELEHGRT